MPRGWDPALGIYSSLRQAEVGWKAAAWGRGDAMSHVPAGIWPRCWEQKVRLVPRVLLLGQLDAPSHSCDVTLSSVTMMYKVLYIRDSELFNF